MGRCVGPVTRLGRKLIDTISVRSADEWTEQDVINMDGAFQQRMLAMMGEGRETPRDPAQRNDVPLRITAARVTPILTSSGCSSAAALCADFGGMGDD